MGSYSFDRADLRSTAAHGGPGKILFSRVVEREPGPGLIFVDLSIVPPGSAVGSHTHGENDEELYIIIEGNGSMTVDGTDVDVGPGDVIVNRPGGTHGLVNTGATPIRMVVVDVGAGGRSGAGLSTPGHEGLV